MIPKFTDNTDDAVELLRIIAENTGEMGQNQSTTLQEGDTIIEEGDVTIGDDSDVDATYYSSGPAPILLEVDDGWQEYEFGFIARILNIRFSGDILVCMTNPHEYPHQAIGLQAGESPFTIGGKVGIDCDSVWVQNFNEEDAVNIQIIAHR